jgi:hypothetical protein
MIVTSLSRESHISWTLLALEDGDGAILPTWTAVDSSNVRTSRELWEYMRSQGWRVEVSATV